MLHSRRNLRKRFGHFITVENIRVYFLWTVPGFLVSWIVPVFYQDIQRFILSLKMSQQKSTDDATRQRLAKDDLQRRQMEFQKALINFRKDWVAQVPEITEKKYLIDKVVGEGTYGLVQRGMDVKTHRKIAIKQMEIDPEKQGLPSVALREVAMLSELQHVNIVGVLDHLIGSRHLFVIFECLDMDLREYQNRYIKEHGRLPVETVRDFTYQMLCGLEYVHDRHFIHRDMKPQNVLIDEANQHIKIADFGLARFFTTPLREMTNEVVTLWYRSPELLLGTDVYTSSVDIWSLGVMLIELVENHPPFDPDSEIRALHLIFQALGTPDSSYWHDVENLKFFCEAFPKWPPRRWSAITPHSPPIIVDLLQNMLLYDPSMRLTCKQALSHPLFQPENGFDASKIYSTNLPPVISHIHPATHPKLAVGIKHPPKYLPPSVRRFSNWEKTMLEQDRKKLASLEGNPVLIQSTSSSTDSVNSDEPESAVLRKSPEMTANFLNGLSKIAFENFRPKITTSSQPSTSRITAAKPSTSRPPSTSQP